MAAVLAEEVAQLNQRCELDLGKLKRRKARVEKRVDKLVLFVEVYEVVEVWLTEIVVVIDGLAPVSEDYETAKDQLSRVRVRHVIGDFPPFFREE